jgi:hypothetical protein
MGKSLFNAEGASAAPILWETFWTGPPAKLPQESSGFDITSLVIGKGHGDALISTNIWEDPCKHLWRGSSICICVQSVNNLNYAYTARASTLIMSLRLDDSFEKKADLVGATEVEYTGDDNHVIDEVQAHIGQAAREELGDGQGVLAVFKKNPRAFLILVVVLVSGLCLAQLRIAHVLYSQRQSLMESN